MPQKLRDIAVKTGEYLDRQSGQTKARWQNVGALMKSDDGNEFIILHRWFNPAGLPNPENRDSVIMSCFKPNKQQGNGQPPANGGGYQQPANQQPQRNQAPPQGQQSYGAPDPSQYDTFDDEIPF
ncbi:hypothetical protein [Halomonas sp. ISL-56]|uniref:hypothetical protein n=1 Tax=Halomonas sp. ISL-56 TaxID=2819149 RepID=UPI0033388010